MPLKEGEKLQSKSGPWAAWITTLMQTYVFAEGTLEELLVWDTSRGTGFQCVAGVVSICQNFSNDPALRLNHSFIKVCNLREPANSARKQPPKLLPECPEASFFCRQILCSAQQVPRYPKTTRYKIHDIR
jgi:hypothetical protein